MQRNVNIFMQNCQNLEALDISHCIEAFRAISFEKFATKNVSKRLKFLHIFLIIWDNGYLYLPATYYL